MNFFTDAEETPPSGFPIQPTFYLISSSPYPNTSMYDVELTLPTVYERYEDFRRNMDMVLQFHGGFGKWWQTYILPYAYCTAYWL